MSTPVISRSSQAPAFSVQAIDTTAIRPLATLAQSALMAAFLALVTLSASGALACEKHLNGHQNGSDTHQEVQSGSQER